MTWRCPHHVPIKLSQLLWPSYLITCFTDSLISTVSPHVGLINMAHIKPLAQQWGTRQRVSHLFPVFPQSPVLPQTLASQAEFKAKLYTESLVHCYFCSDTDFLRSLSFASMILDFRETLVTDWMVETCSYQTSSTLFSQQPITGSMGLTMQRGVLAHVWRVVLIGVGSFWWCGGVCLLLLPAALMVPLKKRRSTLINQIPSVNITKTLATLLDPPILK